MRHIALGVGSFSCFERSKHTTDTTAEYISQFWCCPRQGRLTFPSPSLVRSVEEGWAHPRCSMLTPRIQWFSGAGAVVDWISQCSLISPPVEAPPFCSFQPAGGDCEAESRWTVCTVLKSFLWWYADDCTQSHMYGRAAAGLVRSRCQSVPIVSQCQCHFCFPRTQRTAIQGENGS